MAVPAVTFMCGTDQYGAISSRDAVIGRFWEFLKKAILPNHYFPTESMMNFLEGYSARELENLYRDFGDLYGQMFSSAPRGNCDFLVAVAPPSSGASTLLRELSNKQKLDGLDSAQAGTSRVLIDPDAYLANMQYTYGADNQHTSQEKYNHWIDAATFCATVFLARALQGGYPIAHAGPMREACTGMVLGKVKEHGYQITILHLDCPSSVRRDLSKNSETSGKPQLSVEDFGAEEVKFWKRLPEYVLHANEIRFYTQSSLSERTCVACYTKGKSLTVLDPGKWSSKQNLCSALANASIWKTAIHMMTEKGKSTK